MCVGGEVKAREINHDYGNNFQVILAPGCNSVHTLQSLYAADLMLLLRYPQICPWKGDPCYQQKQKRGFVCRVGVKISLVVKAAYIEEVLYYLQSKTTAPVLELFQTIFLQLGARDSTCHLQSTISRWAFICLLLGEVTIPKQLSHLQGNIS